MKTKRQIFRKFKAKFFFNFKKGKMLITYYSCRKEENNQTDGNNSKIASVKQSDKKGRGQRVDSKRMKI